MVGFTTALALSAAAGAAGSIYSANQQSKAAKRSAQVAQQAGDQNIAEQRRQYDQTRADQMPFLQSDYARRAMADRTYGIQNTGAPQQGQGQVFQGNVGQPDYGGYVRGNADLQAAYDASNGQYGGIEQFGQTHYDTHGRGEGRTIPLFQAQEQLPQQSQINNEPFDPLAEFKRSGDNALVNYEPVTNATIGAFGARGAGFDTSASNALGKALTGLTQNAFYNFRSGLEGSPTGAVNAIGQAGQNMASSNSQNRNNTANALASSYGPRADANSSAVGGVLGAANWFLGQGGFGKPKTTTPSYRGY